MKNLQHRGAYTIMCVMAFLLLAMAVPTFAADVPTSPSKIQATSVAVVQPTAIATDLSVQNLTVSGPIALTTDEMTNTTGEKITLAQLKAAAQRLGSAGVAAAKKGGLTFALYVWNNRDAIARNLAISVSILKSLAYILSLL